MDKYCVIDIGTNSIRMLIAKIERGNIVHIEKSLETTRIGEGVNKTKVLSEAAIARSINVLREFKNEAVKQGIDKINIIATSAVRDAVNRNEFIRNVKNELKLDVEIISGEREAQLGFCGVINGIEINNRENNLLVIDIGGGSTEFVLGNGQGIKYSRSLNVGAVRMTDKHITNDPPTDTEIYSLTEDIRNIINKVINIIKKNKPVQVIGIGGTVTTLTAIALELENYDRKKVHNYQLQIREIEEMIYRFENLNNDERKKIIGLQPKRADIILAGSKILYEILNSLDVKIITISEFDNLEGYIFDHLEPRG
ncbi:Ppx/GppA phosphatase family protein [Maledivibacter halophilus]|uniref:Ppx/GppA phosphatase n=1 Tax=Maledivibacter halophilus TaxID=36842 RepID=A0A1T5MSY6_9FIRM|nr:Ppx/GppA phosphatase family protein [Maledivibacter halophilus]SKC91143.1 Ppx/GppA phosphatase [Maledivibacter halophilus]